MWGQYRGHRTVYIKLPLKISFVAMYLKAFCFKDYINNHLGFGFLMSQLFLIKDTKQTYLYFWLVSPYVSLKRKMRNWGKKKNKRVEKKWPGFPTHTLSLERCLSMLNSNLEVFQSAAVAAACQSWALVLKRKRFQHP